MALMGYRASIRNRELLKKVRKKPEEVGPSRARAAFEDAVEMTRARLLIKKYDEDNSGKLEIDDLKHLLIDLNYGKPVSDDEVRFILSSTDTQRDGAIDYDEIQFVLSIWSTYQRVLPELEDLMEHFDKDRSGRLERNEVHNLLIQLNEGKKVSDREVDFVMQEAGLLGDGKHISKPEIKRAIRAWYTAAIAASPDLSVPRSALDPCHPPPRRWWPCLLGSQIRRLWVEKKDAMGAKDRNRRRRAAVKAQRNGAGCQSGNDADGTKEKDRGGGVGAEAGASQGSSVGHDPMVAAATATESCDSTSTRCSGSASYSQAKGEPQEKEKGARGASTFATARVASLEGAGPVEAVSFFAMDPDEFVDSIFASAGAELEDMYGQDWTMTPVKVRSAQRWGSPLKSRDEKDLMTQSLAEVPAFPLDAGREYVQLACPQMVALSEPPSGFDAPTGYEGFGPVKDRFTTAIGGPGQPPTEKKGLSPDGDVQGSTVSQGGSPTLHAKKQEELMSRITDAIKNDDTGLVLTLMSELKAALTPEHGSFEVSSCSA